MKPFRYLRSVVLVVILIIVSSAAAQEVASVTESPLEITEGVYLLDGLACNILAVTGHSGVLLIDNGYVGDAKQLNGAIDALGAGKVVLTINTHFHFDHVGANAALAGIGAVIVAHEGTRRRLMAEWKLPENSLDIIYPVVPASPEIALPMVTFTDSVTVHFGGHEIEIRHLPGAHSDSDAAVFLRAANILHTGDLFLSNGFPPIDSFHGGTIDGLIDALDTMIGWIDNETIVAPGHGAMSNRRELREYREMIAAARDRIAAMIDDGMSLEQIVAANPTAGLFRRGESWVPPKFFVWTAYEDLARKR